MVRDPMASPPNCSHCDEPVGLWEPIVTRPQPREWTTWLRLADDGALPDAIWHLDCAEELA